MKIGSNCFIVNCDLALTMKKMCVVEACGGFYYTVHLKEDSTKKFFANPNNIRAPKNGEVKSGVRLFD